MQNHLCVHAMQLCQLGCNVFAVLLAGKCFQRCALARFWSTLAMLKIWAATNFCYKWAYTQTFAVACTTSIAAPLMLHFMKFKHFEHTHTHTHTHTGQNMHSNTHAPSLWTKVTKCSRTSSSSEGAALWPTWHGIWNAWDWCWRTTSRAGWYTHIHI